MSVNIKYGKEVIILLPCIVRRRFGRRYGISIGILFGRGWTFFCIVVLLVILKRKGFWMLPCMRGLFIRLSLRVIVVGRPPCRCVSDYKSRTSGVRLAVEEDPRWWYFVQVLLHCKTGLVWIFNSQTRRFCDLWPLLLRCSFWNTASQRVIGSVPSLTFYQIIQQYRI